MFGKKKPKNEGLPDIPEDMRTLPSISDYYRKKIPLEPMPDLEGDEIHSLPSFPDSPMSKGFSQSAIKDAIKTKSNSLFEDNNPNKLELPNHNENNENQMIEMEEWKPPQQEMIPSIKSPQVNNQISRHNIKKPVFVKLEKFREAKESLDIIKDKLGEMDELLKIIKEIKIKENQELSQWETEMEKIKARINSVNANVFEDTF